MALTETARKEIIINGEKADATLKDLIKYSNMLNKELKEMPTNSEKFQQKAQELGSVRTKLKEVNDEVKQFGPAANTNNSLINTLKTNFFALAASIGLAFSVEAVVAFVGKLIGMQSKLSDLQADIQKSTGMSKKEVQELTSALQLLDTRTPLNNLLEISKVGGQIGVASNEMLGFVKAVDMAVVALGDEFSGGVEEVAREMGGLQKLFKDTENLTAGDAITKIGSAINALGAAGTATGPVIAEFTKRLGALGGLAPSITETAGLGAAFQELGLSAEIASGGLTQILTTAAKESETFAKFVGKSTKEFEALVNSNPNEMLLLLAQRFKGLEETDVMKTLEGLK